MDIGAGVIERTCQQTYIARSKFSIFILGKFFTIDVDTQLAAHAIAAQVIQLVALDYCIGRGHIILTDQLLLASRYFADSVIAIAADHKKVEILAVLITTNDPIIVVVVACDFGGVHLDPGIREVQAGIGPDIGVGCVDENPVNPVCIIGYPLIDVHLVPPAGGVREVILEQNASRFLGAAAGGSRLAGKGCQHENC